MELTATPCTLNDVMAPQPASGGVGAGPSDDGPSYVAVRAEYDMFLGLATDGGARRAFAA